jgi:putative endonuclease
VWRSWLAYLHGVQVVVSSSLTTPTNKKVLRRLFLLVYDIMNYVVYILYSSSIDKFYIGQTYDLERRMEQHVSGYGNFTSRANDWKLIFERSFESRAESIQNELKIKKRGAKRFLQDEGILKS